MPIDDSSPDLGVPQFMHTPAEVLQYYIVAKGFGTDPLAGLAWPVTHDGLPALPNNAISVNNTVGIKRGRWLRPGGRVLMSYGWQLRFRGIGYEVARSKGRQVRYLVDRTHRELVTVDDAVYRIHSISRTTDLIRLPEDENNCDHFTLNGTAQMSVVYEGGEGFDLYDLLDLYDLMTMT